MHTAAVLTKDRLRHESGVNAILLGDLLDDQPVGHGVVGNLEGVVVADVDLVLAGADLVVAILNVDAHLFEGHDSVTAQIAGDIQWSKVEVAALVQYLGALGILEIEELEFRPDIKMIETHLCGPLEGALELVTRVAEMGFDHFYVGPELEFFYFKDSKGTE